MNPDPEALKQVGIEQRLDEQVPLDALFRDEQGREVRLGDYFGARPVVLALVYYTCPMLCDQILSALTKTVTTLSFDAGKEFEIVVVSFDPRETPQQARDKKFTYLNWYKREGAEAGWHFLTGDDQQIKRLTTAVGFNYTFDEKTGQFAHASGIMVLTPGGKLSRYFYGLEYAPKDVKLGLVEASENKIGSVVDQLLLYCFHYDPATGRYGLVVMNIVRAVGVMTLAGVVALVMVMKRRRARLGQGSEAGGAI
jgi:protein SCO1/2